MAVRFLQKKEWWILFAVLLLVTGCLGGTSGTVERVNVTVEVKDASTDEPIDATVTLAGNEETTVFGLASFSNIRTGNQWLDVAAPGYDTTMYPKQITIVKSDEPIKVELEPSVGSITGTALYPTDNDVGPKGLAGRSALANADAYLYEFDIEPVLIDEDTTNADGEFSFPTIPAERDYYVVIVGSGVKVTTLVPAAATYDDIVVSDITTGAAEAYRTAVYLPPIDVSNWEAVIAEAEDLFENAPLDVALGGLVFDLNGDPQATLLDHTGLQQLALLSQDDLDQIALDFIQRFATSHVALAESAMGHMETFGLYMDSAEPQNQYMMGFLEALANNVFMSLDALMSGAVFATLEYDDDDELIGSGIYKATRDFDGLALHDKQELPDPVEAPDWQWWIYLTEEETWLSYTFYDEYGLLELMAEDPNALSAQNINWKEIFTFDFAAYEGQWEEGSGYITAKQNPSLASGSVAIEVDEDFIGDLSQLPEHLQVHVEAVFLEDNPEWASQIEASVYLQFDSDERVQTIHIYEGTNVSTPLLYGFGEILITDIVHVDLATTNPEDDEIFMFPGTVILDGGFWLYGNDGTMFNTAPLLTIEGSLDLRLAWNIEMKQILPLSLDLQGNYVFSGEPMTTITGDVQWRFPKAAVYVFPGSNPGAEASIAAAVEVELDDVTNQFQLNLDLDWNTLTKPVLDIAYQYPTGYSMAGTLEGHLLTAGSDLDMDKIILTMTDGTEPLRIEVLFEGTMSNMSGKIRRLDSGMVIGVMDAQGVMLFRSGETATWQDLLPF